MSELHDDTRKLNKEIENLENCIEKLEQQKEKDKEFIEILCQQQAESALEYNKLMTEKAELIRGLSVALNDPFIKKIRRKIMNKESRIIITEISNVTKRGIALHTNIPAQLKTGNIKSNPIWVSWDKIGEALLSDYMQEIEVQDAKILRGEQKETGGEG